MAGKSTAAAREVLNHYFRTATAAKRANVFISLHSSDPTDANLTATELPIGTGGYARLSVAVGDGSWSAPATSGAEEMIANAGLLNFGSASADLGTITHFGIYDAATAGNLLYSGPLGTPRTVLSGDPITIAPGSLLVFEG